ncbi:hypothetical protein [Kangiella sediminilitoris]|uniref:Uncharacterized protein n=1 Tax=Kangiella sediminilitoris TaxID=1144748 RepID=A0A1B3B9P6_9GAMM|nr:hypothetical protein [Kangiella sediminilitoris]AOE49524.1 hypothetical protein KS2013_801 [Kangiella sediminilitoris]
MKYKEYKDASNRQVVALDGCSRFTSKYIRWRIVRKFSLTKSEKLFDDLDSVSNKYCKQQETVLIEWDTWSGLTVTAVDSLSEKLVLEIGGFVKKFT